MPPRHAPTGERDEPFRCDQSFCLNPRLREQTPQFRGRLGCCRVGPTTDHAKIRPQSGQIFATQRLDQQHQERRIPHRDERQIPAFHQMPQRYASPLLDAGDVPYRGRHGECGCDQPAGAPCIFGVVLKLSAVCPTGESAQYDRPPSMPKLCWNSPQSTARCAFQTPAVERPCTESISWPQSYHWSARAAVRDPRFPAVRPTTARAPETPGCSGVLRTPGCASESLAAPAAASRPPAALRAGMPALQAGTTQTRASCR